VCARVVLAARLRHRAQVAMNHMKMNHMKMTWLRLGRRTRLCLYPAQRRRHPLNRRDFLKQSSGFPNLRIVLGSRAHADGRDL
jgi:hypothetical protein